MAHTADRDDDEGVVFPVGRDGRRSTSDTGRAIFADALRAANPVAAAATERERDWRARYLVHARRLVEEGAASPAAANAIALAGLRSAQRRLQFARGDEVHALEVALKHPHGRLHTHSVAGIGKGGPAPLAVPYRGRLLTGDSLRRQIDRWEADGLCEPSFAQAL